MKYALIKIHEGMEDAPKDRGIMMRAVTESNHDPEWTSGYWSEYDKAWIYDADSCAIEIEPDAWFDFPNTLTDVITPLVEALEQAVIHGSVIDNMQKRGMPPVEFTKVDTGSWDRIQQGLAALKEQMK